LIDHGLNHAAISAIHVIKSWQMRHRYYQFAKKWGSGQGTTLLWETRCEFGIDEESIDFQVAHTTTAVLHASRDPQRASAGNHPQAASDLACDQPSHRENELRLAVSMRRLLETLCDKLHSHRGHWAGNFFGVENLIVEILHRG
jgi:hypothetical protein